MSYNVSYENLRGDAADTKAIADIKEYVGLEKFTELDQLLFQAVKTGEIQSIEKFCMVMFMFPVSGFPLHAWYRDICKRIDSND